MNSRSFTLVALLASVSASSSFAQDASAAVRQACWTDLQSRCAGIQPGSGRLNSCLKSNDVKLSADCKAAMDAVAKPGTQKTTRRSSTRSPAQ